MTYDEAMEALQAAAWDAVKAADNEGGAPVDKLTRIAEDLDSIANCGLTVKEYNDAYAFYLGAKQAGLTR